MQTTTKQPIIKPYPYEDSCSLFLKNSGKAIWGLLANKIAAGKTTSSLNEKNYTID